MHSALSSFLLALEAGTLDRLLDETTRLVIRSAILEAEIQAELDTRTHVERPAEMRSAVWRGISTGL